MNSITSVPDELKKYDTPETRQAYQAYKMLSPQTQQQDSGDGIPADLQRYDTAAARSRYLSEQRTAGLTTSDNRFYRLSDDQYNFVSNRFKSSWDYRHDALDQEAAAAGAMPPSMYSSYSKKSQYDQWALMAGMPNEKELEKYLSEYDTYRKDVDKYAVDYSKKLDERNEQAAVYQGVSDLQKSFYDDVSDRLYRAEFRGVDRGTDEWFNVFYNTLSEPKYQGLWDYYSDDDGDRISRLVSAATARQEQPSAFLQAAAAKAAAKPAKTSSSTKKETKDPDAFDEAAAREKWGDLFPTLPEIPELQVPTFGAGSFYQSYTAGVNTFEGDQAPGRLNGAVRDAASKIGYTTYDTVSESGFRGGRSSINPYATPSAQPVPTYERDGEEVTLRNAPSGRVYKLANGTDTSAVCADLAVAGYSTEEYWSVVGGLMSTDYGAGFLFDQATQDKISAYSNVISTRFGSDILGLVMNGKSSRNEDMNAFVQRAINEGATKELLQRAYEVTMDALGGTEGGDTSRDWDGRSQSQRKTFDAEFKAAFEAAANTAPSIPIGSGWYGETRTKEENEEIAARRAAFDMDKVYKELGAKSADETTAALAQQGFGGSQYGRRPSAGAFQAAANKAYEEAYAAAEEFRAQAKEHGYSDWEVDQYFREKGTLDVSAEPLAEHYREFLVESAAGNQTLIDYINTVSEADLSTMMDLDSRTAGNKTWALYNPVWMAFRGSLAYAAGFVNLADMVANGMSDENGTLEAAEYVNKLNSLATSMTKHDNQSKALDIIVDAGSELFRMYLVSKTGGAFGELVGGAAGLFGEAGTTAATWLSSGTKAAELVKWGIESVPFITSAMGSSYAEARSEGASNKDAAKYGLLAGVVEGFTEKMGADIVFGKLGNAIVGKLMSSGVSKILTGKLGVVTVNLIKMAMNSLSEAAEEGTSYVLDLLLKKEIYDPSASFSWKELGAQAGMGALTGAMGLAFQNYGQSYVNSMLEFAMSSDENFQKFTNFAMDQFGVNLGTDENYVVKASDYDPSKLVPTEEYNEAWKNYLDANDTLQAAQRQYDAAIASLNADDTEKSQQVAYWRNQVESLDSDDPASAKRLVTAMEQLVIAERSEADTHKKNDKLRADARTELNNVRRRTQNQMAASSAVVRDHSRAAVAATLTAMGSSESQPTDEARAYARTAMYNESVTNAVEALDELGRAEAAQRAAKDALYSATVSSLATQIAANNPVAAGALETVNGLAAEQQAEAERLDAAADELTARIQSEKRRQAQLATNQEAAFSTIDAQYAAWTADLTTRQAAAYTAYKAGDITENQYATELSDIMGQLEVYGNVRDQQRASVAASYAAAGGETGSMQALADAFRRDAAEARAKADDIRNAVVRAYAYRTQEAALAAMDEIQTSDGVLTEEQRQALSDEMNQIVAEGLLSDAATQMMLDAFDSTNFTTEQRRQETAQTASQASSEVQNAAEPSAQDRQTQTTEERQAELQKAVAVGKMLGVEVQVTDDLPKQIAGRYTNGVLYISRNADNAPMRVLVHEMTHYLEGTTAYQQLQNYVFASMSGDPNFNLATEIASYRALYADARAEMGQEPLSDAEAEEEAKAEITARWCEKNLFTNEESIARLTNQRQSLAKRILNGIQNMLAGHRTDSAAAELQRAEKLYIKALHQAKAFGGARTERNSVVSTLVAAGLYVDATGDGLTVYRTRYDANGQRTVNEVLEPNYDSPVDGPITTDDILNHSPIGAYIRLGQKYGNVAPFNANELQPGVNLRAIPSEKLSDAAKMINLWTDVANMSLAYKDSGFTWNMIGGYVFSSITSNSDPQYSRTIDFGTICRKTQNLVTAMSNAMKTKGRGLYAEEIIDLQNQMINNGRQGGARIDAPCSMCYVFSRWLGLGGYLNRIKVYQDRYSAMTPEQVVTAFQEVQDQLDSVLHPKAGEGNFAETIRELAAQHGLDAESYLAGLSEAGIATKTNRYGDRGWVQGAKSELKMSDAKERSLQIMEDAQTYIRFLEDCLESYDLKGIKDPTRLAAYQDLQSRMDLVDAYGWLTKVLVNVDKNGNVKLKPSVLSKDGQSWKTDAEGKVSFVVPTDVLFDLNASDRFAQEYPDVWSFRTSGGPTLGKATYGYTDSRLGEYTYGAAVNAVKSQAVPRAPRYGIGDEQLSRRNKPANKLSYVNWKGDFESGGEAKFRKAMDNIKRQSYIGGERMQSSSDYTSRNALDYLMTAFEMQCLGAPVQTYSKVPEGIGFMSAIGASNNISLIAKGKGFTGKPVLTFNEATGRYTIKPGSASLVFSTVQGVDPEIGRMLATINNSSQCILVAMSREHAALAISQPWLHMIIPVHMSGGTVDNISARAVAQGDPALVRNEINDATDCQNDKPMTREELVAAYGEEGAQRRLTAREIRKAALFGTLKGNTRLEAQIDAVDSENGLLRAMVEDFEARGITMMPSKGNELGLGIYPAEYWDKTSTIENADVNSDRFLEYCDMLGVTPRFSYGAYGEQGKPGDPDYYPGLHRFEGYWKSLIDREMYNTWGDEAGTYREATPVSITGLTANMLNGMAPTSAATRQAEYLANAENLSRMEEHFKRTYDKYGLPRPNTGAYLYDAAESAKIRAQEAAAAEVGTQYASQMQGTAAEAMEAQARKSSERYALSGDVEARLAELRKQYGAMPTTRTETAPGRENVVLPLQTNDDTYVRRSAQTFMRSPNITDASASEIGQSVLKGDFDYERKSNDETISKAQQMIIDMGGHQAALQHLEAVARGRSRATAETVAIGEQLILEAQAVGDANAFEKAVIYTSIIGTSAGQTVQAFSLINKLSPQGVALYIQHVLDRLNNVEYKKLIDSGKMSALKLTEDQTKKLLGVKSFSDAKRVQTEILTEIAGQIPLTMKEQLRNWRYLCMLGNVRTNVRNICGNLAMASMRMGRDLVAAGYEAIDVALGERLSRQAAEAARAGDTAKAEALKKRASQHLSAADRTKALPTGPDAEAFRANREYARGTLADAEEVLSGGGKDTMLSVIGRHKRMFNNRILNKVGTTALSPLEIMDVKFLEPLYVNSFAQYMTARGLTPDTISFKQRGEAMKYAVQEAQEATFRDANWLATKLTEIRSRNLVSEIFVGGLLPFAKTPANVLRRGVEYSPAGIIDGISKLHKANTDTSLSQSERMQLRTTAIERLASGTTGTGMLAIGLMLRALGVLRGKEDEDSRVAKYFRDMGRQAYSAEVGDVSMTLDWLAPMNMPMFMGAAMWDVAQQLSEGEELGWKDIAEPLLSIADPLIEMSLLQGIQNALQTYGTSNTLSSVLTNAGQSFVGQFYPTIGGQLARTIDLTRRSPDSNKYWIQSMMAKIPGLSKLVKPYVGGYGEEEIYAASDNPVINYSARAFEQFILPGYVKVTRRDELTDELTRLYNETGVNSFLPQRPSDYKKINLGKKSPYGIVELTYEQQVEWEKAYRGAAAEALLAAISSEEYKGLSDADKADLLSGVYSAATAQARKDFKAKLTEELDEAALQQQRKANP